MPKPVPDDFRPKNVLVIQLRQIGDVILSTPALRALRKRFPEAGISYLAEPLPAEVLELNNNIDRLIIREPGGGPFEALHTIKRVRDAKFDLVIDFLSNPRSTLIAMLSGAKVTIGHTRNLRRLCYTRAVELEGTFPGEHKLSVLRSLGCDPEPMDLDLPVPDHARQSMVKWFEEAGLSGSPRPVVCVAPFHKRPVRQYPAEGFLDIIELLKNKWGATIILCREPGREAEAGELASRSKVPVTLGPRTTLHQAAALYGLCDLWIGNEGGARHIAASQGAPTFAILGPSSDQWTPPGQMHVSRGKPGLECRPCLARHCPEKHHKCMREFEPKEVFQMIEEFWQGIGEQWETDNKSECSS